MNNKVESFMSKLSAQTAPMVKNTEKTKNRSIEKISLNFEGNFGRYQVLPMDNVVTDYPYVTLFNTREICIPRKKTDPDNQEKVWDAWIKILPKSAYIMKDASGRTVSSLTSEEDALLSEAYTLFDMLYDEIDARNNRDLAKDLIRKRNYTIFHAMCLNKWKFDDNSRMPDRQNFCGLFVCTAKGFITSVEDNIKEKSLMENGDVSWIDGIYNQNLTGRDGFVLFSISRSKTGAGYTVTVSHEAGRAEMLKNFPIPEEDAALMKDPTATFLGWQANREEDVDPTQRRLFNASLIREAIDFMTAQLAGIRMAKANGGDILGSTKTTSEQFLNGGASAPTAPIAAPVDTSMGNTEMPVNGHIDPVATAAPAPEQAAPFAQPTWANNGFGKSASTPF